jgi:hypothetical protein
VIWVWLLLAWVAAAALVTFGWCLRAGTERNSRGQVDLSRAAARGELGYRPHAEGPPPTSPPARTGPSLRTVDRG